MELYYLQYWVLGILYRTLTKYFCLIFLCVEAKFCDKGSFKTKIWLSRAATSGHHPPSENTTQSAGSFPPVRLHTNINVFIVWGKPNRNIKQ